MGDQGPEPEAAAITNVDRLLHYLEADTLAAKLVVASKDQTNADGLAQVLTDRLDQVRGNLDGR